MIPLGTKQEEWSRTVGFEAARLRYFGGLDGPGYVDEDDRRDVGE